MLFYQRTAARLPCFVSSMACQVKRGNAMSQVVVFLMVLFITQTFRHERIMELAQQVANADLERSR